jgi:rubrerythrin
MDKDFMEFILSIPKIAKELERLNNNLEKEEESKPQAYLYHGIDKYICSNCGYTSNVLFRSPCCPQCHAVILEVLD